jgi:hypothetical protein
MIAYEVIVDGETVCSTIYSKTAEALADGWRNRGRRVAIKKRFVPEELVELVSLCHRMNIERCRGQFDEEALLFAEIMAICGECKP